MVSRCVVITLSVDECEGGDVSNFEHNNLIINVATEVRVGAAM